MDNDKKFTPQEIDELTAKTKFTPGPWRIFKGTTILNKDGFTLAKCCLFTERREETYANTRLIVKAPGLYDFAKFFLSFQGQLLLRILGQNGIEIYNEAKRLVNDIDG